MCFSPQRGDVRQNRFFVVRGSRLGAVAIFKIHQSHVAHYLASRAGAGACFASVQSGPLLVAAFSRAKFCDQHALSEVVVFSNRTGVQARRPLLGRGKLVVGAFQPVA